MDIVRKLDARVVHGKSAKIDDFNAFLTQRLDRRLVIDADITSARPVEFGGTGVVVA